MLDQKWNIRLWMMLCARQRRNILVQSTHRGLIIQGKNGERVTHKWFDQIWVKITRKWLDQKWVKAHGAKRRAQSVTVQ
jgi:hypothetical protein